MVIHEIRQGDLNIRAGVVITNGSLLLCGQPTNMTRNGWKLDIFKGHVQEGEKILDAAIRECWEESAIHFEPWKLTNPIQITYKNAPLYLFLAKIDKIIPTSILYCVSTFIDNADGLRKPEIEAYRWINPYSEICLVQEELRYGIMHYFNKFREDCQIAGSMLGSVPPNINKVLSLKYKPEKEQDEYELYEMATLSPLSAGNIIMSQIFTLYSKFRNNVDSLVRRAVNYLTEKGHPLKFKMTDNKEVDDNNINAYANAVVAHCEGIAHRDSTPKIKTKNKKGLDPVSNFIEIPEFSTKIKPKIKYYIIELFNNNYTKIT